MSNQDINAIGRVAFVSPDRDPLEGLFFLCPGLGAESIKDNTYQGEIIKHVRDGVYLVLFYSWLSGYATNMTVLAPTDRWQLFYSKEDWNAAAARLSGAAE